MQFLLQLIPHAAEPRMLLLFMCQNDVCSEWEADSGGNRVIPVQGSDLALAIPPTSGNVLRETRHGAKLISVDGSDYDSARDDWAKVNQQSRRLVLGQLLGGPSWLQGDQTPTCDHCKEPMKFVAQLEEGAKTPMNFGGGCAYVFECRCGGDSAKMLWQC